MLEKASPRNRKLLVPITYSNESHANKDILFSDPLEFLTKNDTTYVTLSATKILTEFYPKVINHLKTYNTPTLIQKRKSLQTKLLQIKTLRGKYLTEYPVKHIQEKQNAKQNTHHSSISHQDISDDSSLPGDKDVDENPDERENEIVPAIDDEGELKLPVNCCTINDIDDIITKLENYELRLSNFSVDVNDYIDDSREKRKKTKEKLEENVNLFNKFIDNFPDYSQTVEQDVLDDLENQYAIPSDQIQLDAEAFNESIIENSSTTNQIINLRLKDGADFFIEFLKMELENVNATDEIKNKIRENLIYINEKETNIKNFSKQIKDNSKILQTIEQKNNLTFNDIKEIALQITKIFNELQQEILVSLPPKTNYDTVMSLENERYNSILEAEKKRQEDERKRQEELERQRQAEEQQQREQAEREEAARREMERRQEAARIEAERQEEARRQQEYLDDERNHDIDTRKTVIGFFS